LLPSNPPSSVSFRRHPLHFDGAQPAAARIVVKPKIYLIAAPDFTYHPAQVKEKIYAAFDRDEPKILI
jgi:hypothetical protein